MISEIKVTINNDEQNVSVPSTHAEESSLRLNVFAATDLVEEDDFVSLPMRRGGIKFVLLKNIYPCRNICE